MDSLYNKKLINSLVVVAIHTGDRMKEYGIANYPDYKNNGARCSKVFSILLTMNCIFLLKRKRE
ncbi:MAG: hypothetical protein WKF59_00310 [Chitinophagaceae bacterium]